MAAYKTASTILEIGATEIASVTSIGDVGLTNETFESSDLSSTYKTFASKGLIDPGEISISGFFDPNDTSGQKAMYDLVATGVLTAFTITWGAANADFSFNAIVTNFKVNSDYDGDGIGFEATLRVSGEPTLGVTASGGLTNLAMAGAGGALSPSFGAAVRYYTFLGVSATSVTVTPTAASHTIKVYVDGTYVETVASGSASSAIALTINVPRKITILAFEAGKTTQVTEIITEKQS